MNVSKSNQINEHLHNEDKEYLKLKSKFEYFQRYLSISPTPQRNAQLKNVNRIKTANQQYTCIIKVYY